jgi:penicillin-binding protein 1B
VVDAGAADVLADMLQTVFTDGTAAIAAKMGFDAPAGGKTGTTSNYRDSWFAGFTPQLTTVTWVGEDQGSVEKAPKDGSKDPKAKRIILTGATGALPIWTGYMKKAISIEPPEAFPVSPNVENVMIDLHSGKSASSGCPPEQAIMEKYVKGHEPRSSSCDPGWPESSPETVGK